MFFYFYTKRFLAFRVSVLEIWILLCSHVSLDNDLRILFIATLIFVICHFSMLKSPD